MKKLVLLSAIAMSSLLYNTADAQLGIHISFHLFPHRFIEAPGPVIVQAPAYQEPVTYADNADDFYYLPDVGAYYSVDEQLYYYFDGENWIATAYLPGVYSDYDWRYARRFEIREAHPYLNNDFYRNKYQGFDCDLVHNHDHFREGFNYQNNRDTYNAPQRFNDQGFDHRFDNNRGGYNQHFDNRGGSDQKFDNRGNDNRFDNRGQAGFDRKDNGDARNNEQGGQQFSQDRNKGNFDGQQANQDKGKRDKQDRLAQNERGYDGHKDGMKDRF